MYKRPIHFLHLFSAASHPSSTVSFQFSCIFALLQLPLGTTVYFFLHGSSRYFCTYDCLLTLRHESFWHEYRILFCCMVPYRRMYYQRPPWLYYHTKISRKWLGTWVSYLVLIRYLLGKSLAHIKLFMTTHICIKQGQNRGIWRRPGPSESLSTWLESLLPRQIRAVYRVVNCFIKLY